MKIAVCVKQTPDTEARIELVSGGQGIEEAQLTWIISPHDESAVEQALQLKEEHGGHVTVVTLGPARAERAVREALAMGADEGEHLLCDTMPQDATATAAALAEALTGREYDLILTGEASIDDAGSQVPQRLAIALGWPCVTAVESLRVAERTVYARRPLGQAEAAITCSLPSVVGINRRIGEPRYPSFKGIMQAKRKNVSVTRVSLPESAIRLDRLEVPPAKAQGHVQPFDSDIVETVAQLLLQHAGE